MAEYIEREAVCNNCNNIKICVDKSRCPVGRTLAADVVERKRGEWVEGERGYLECTECKFERIGIPLVHHLNFYPNCGADMRNEVGVNG